MGQAWCKEKTTRAQDSKSPLDRVFVRCMHRIYPSLKEEGSVLGGATQRVTSSEIGYAGSPPREALARGRSIDSVDRPFHPSDWVDVNLEVPSTPRASSALTNLTVDTSLYPATAVPTSSCRNLKDVTPVPPPRRRKRNKGRPLPPKPDEISAENSSSGSKRHEAGDEPLYSSVTSPRSSWDEQQEDAEEETRTDEQFHDAGRDESGAKEIYEHKVNGTGRIISSDVVSGKRPFESSKQHQRKSDEYERFARSRTGKDSSTPNREEERRRSTEIERQTMDSSGGRGKSASNARPKNFSTVSLPNYDELDVARHRPEGNDEHEQRRDKTRKAARPVRSSTGSLPAESFLSPFSEKTSVRLEDYIPRSDNLSPYQVLEKLNRGANSVVRDEFVRYDPDKPEDWELGDAGSCEVNRQRCFTLQDTSDEGSRVREDGEDVVDFSKANSPKDEGRSSSPLANKDVPASTIHLEKPEAFGKTASPFVGQPEYAELDPNRSHLKYDPPKLTDSCGISCARGSSGSKEPFFLDEAKHRSALGAIGGSTEPRLESDRSGESRASEDESKELHSRASNLIRTISEESLPREMLEEQELADFFDEKLAKDVRNSLKKSLDDWKTKTPPPSPEPKPKPANSDHSTSLKVVKEETAEESNLSSMTPSLTELEAALSDMLEKEDSQEVSKDEAKSSVTNEQLTASFHHETRTGENSDDANAAVREIPTSLKQILGEKKLPLRKVSFCAWEESDQASIDRSTSAPRLDEDRGAGHFSLDVPPEKPSRLNRSLDDLAEEIVPTPPRRRNRSLCGAAKREPEVAQNGTASKHLSNDRLI